MKKRLDINEKIIENFVHLQKTMVTLAEKLDKLTINIAELLKLFEGAAVAFAKKQGQVDIEKDKEFLEKLNILLDQNKTIAKGLTMMEEKMREKLYGIPSQQSEEEKIRIKPRPFPTIV